MADLNVERKGPNVWPWVVGLIVLALLIWALTQVFSGDRTRATGTAPADTVSVDTARAVTTPAVPAGPMREAGIPQMVGPGEVTDTPMMPPPIAPGATTQP
ncbi:hypothetical protein BH23GEM3_BH23GEM3_20870 [soil metagenome]